MDDYAVGERIAHAVYGWPGTIAERRGTYLLVQWDHSLARAGGSRQARAGSRAVFVSPSRVVRVAQ